jgi:hypothetical protein
MSSRRQPWHRRLAAAADEIATATQVAAAASAAEFATASTVELAAGKAS